MLKIHNLVVGRDNIENLLFPNLFKLIKILIFLERPVNELVSCNGAHFLFSGKNPAKC